MKDLDHLLMGTHPKTGAQDIFLPYCTKTQTYTAAVSRYASALTLKEIKSYHTKHNRPLVKYIREQPASPAVDPNQLDLHY